MDEDAEPQPGTANQAPLSATADPDAMDTGSEASLPAASQPPLVPAKEGRVEKVGLDNFEFLKVDTSCLTGTT